MTDDSRLKIYKHHPRGLVAHPEPRKLILIINIISCTIAAATEKKEASVEGQATTRTVATDKLAF